VLRRQQERGEHGAGAAPLDRNSGAIRPDEAEGPDKLDMEAGTDRRITPMVFRNRFHANLVPAPVT
jgi:hypothetical protein